MTWLRVRKVVQVLLLVAFIMLTVGTERGWSWLPPNLPLRLDPLVGLAAVFASRAWAGFWAAALVTVLVTVLLGRVWCGWICPLGTMLDIVPARRRKPRERIDRRWGAGKYVTLAVVLGAALLGSLGPMVLDPVTIMTRPLQEIARPFAGTDALGQSIGAFLARDLLAPIAYLSLVPLALVLALNAVQRRLWCRDLCPLGALLALVSLVPGVRRLVSQERCTSCGRCSVACVTDAVDRTAGHVSSPAECTVCMECVDACPSAAITFGVSAAPPNSLEFQQSRRDALLVAGATGLGVGLVMFPKTASASEILRPPFTDEKRLAELCVRCGACYSACPAGALRPSLSLVSEAGPWTPMLDERPAFCSASCNRCARPCPTDAIHTPTPAEAAVLGIASVASVNKSQCRAWARNHDCMLCQQACPISGALVGQERPADAPPSRHRPVQVPVVVASECVACNLCMSACPMMPPAIGVDLPAFEGTGRTLPRMPQARPGGSEPSAPDPR